MSADLGSQPKPDASMHWPGLQEHRRYIELRFPSPEMADAYLAWLKSGEAHNAFGEWNDRQPHE